MKVYCKNNSTFYTIECGSTLSSLLEQINYTNEFPILAAYVDNRLKELSYTLYMEHSIEFIDITYPDGRRVYNRSLSFIAQKAISELYPNSQLILDYSLPNGLYGELTELPCINTPFKILPTKKITKSDILAIKEKMKEIISCNKPIIKVKKSSTEAIEIFNNNNQFKKSKLISSLGNFFVSIYYIGNYADTFYGPLVPSTGAIDKFDIIPYSQGFCLRTPSIKAPHNIETTKLQDKLAEVFDEHSTWCNIIGAKEISSVNNSIINGKAAEIIQISEALHEKKYAAIADKIYEKKDTVKLILIAGPSSSGKTTTSNRVALQLKVIGLTPVVIAMDNYFVNREDTPIDENGEFDFESLKAMDLELLNSHLNSLLNGDEVEIPKFNFTSGSRYFDGTKLKLKESDILIMEGIHALNPELTEKISANKKIHIYASALTSLSIDENNNISTTDSRLIRRMVRDNNFRGTTAEDTILRWQSVRSGEIKNIFPFQENADIMFNSALIYELPLLKYFAEPLLRRISPTSKAYAESLRLLKFLSYIVELNPKEQAGVPPTSIMREFIGGGVFEVG